MKGYNRKVPIGWCIHSIQLISAHEWDYYTLMLAGHAALMSYYYSGTYDEKVGERMTIMGKIRFLE